MSEKDLLPGEETRISRRKFILAGGATVAGGALSLSGCATRREARAVTEPDLAAGAEFEMHYRQLGRTGFAVSDISLGAGRINEPNVVRYAYDHGVNYIDTAEVYGNGDSETKIGQAMQFMDRQKIFITTKLWVEPETTEDEIIERFGKCLERLQTDYADALYQHGVADVRIVGHEGFHRAVAQLKAAGKLKHAGISSHGPRDDEPDSMEKVLIAAVEDGRFDSMLLSYNFMNKEEAERVLAACKERNIGTTIMKSAPGKLQIDPFDPENPSEDYAEYIESFIKNGGTREQAIERIQNWLLRQEATLADTKAFAEKHGIKSEDELKAKSIQWVLQNPNIHTVCVSMQDFDQLDKFLPLSGVQLSVVDQTYLRDYAAAYGSQYCRHGCSQCVQSCPSRLPVSTIMRYSYYYACQGREKFAMAKYARLAGAKGAQCLDCHAPCEAACPHGVSVQAQVLKAHSLLTFA